MEEAMRKQQNERKPFHDTKYRGRASRLIRLNWMIRAVNQNMLVLKAEGKLERKLFTNKTYTHQFSFEIASTPCNASSSSATGPVQKNENKNVYINIATKVGGAIR